VGLLRDQVDQVARGERSAVELLEHALAAAEKLQPDLNAFTQIYDDAIEIARQADAQRGDTRGLLAGVPVAVKDLFDVAGRVTSGCSRPYLDRPPAEWDAPAVAALRRAGGVVIGKTNMHELAFGATTTVSCFGPCNNPWDPERMPGGSSGGSAAVVAARIVGLALGTDTGGSIRIPSSFCGTSGLKTTWGLLPLHGVLPMAPSLDSVGPIASDASDLALAYEALTGEESGMRFGYETPKYRVGLARDPHLDVVRPEVAAAVEGVAEILGKDAMRGVGVPWLHDADEAWLTVSLAEFGREHRRLADHLDELDPSIAIILQAGIAVPGDYERQAREAIVAARAEFDELMREVDILVLPSTPIPAPRHADETLTVAGVDLPVHVGGQSHFTRPISTIAAPVACVPCGFVDSLPVGVQLVGRHGDERFLLHAAEAFQRETDWHTRVPSVHA
jgi:Asp-tRNA(Asn)/Glu-tRNA(Gln) amidotransferase A subunit family amidase